MADRDVCRMWLRTLLGRNGPSAVLEVLEELIAPPQEDPPADPRQQQLAELLQQARAVLAQGQAEPSLLLRLEALLQGRTRSESGQELRWGLVEVSVPAPGVVLKLQLGELQHPYTAVLVTGVERDEYLDYRWINRDRTLDQDQNQRQVDDLLTWMGQQAM